MLMTDLTAPAGRRALLRRGAASAILATAVIIGRRALSSSLAI